jgi:release factor glutamine methyltransferase
MDATTAGAWMEEASARLRAERAPHPRRDALLLLSDVLGQDKAIVLAHGEVRLSSDILGRLDMALSRRLGREPLQYIRGFHEFWGLRVLVGPGCLVPRPETEHLVHESLEALRGIPRPRVAEVGAGSGCILMALAQERPDGLFWGVERSGDALAWASQNCAPYQNVRLLRGDLEGIPVLRGLDLLVSNPPYITDGEWEGLPPEVRGHEPSQALRCGGEALGIYRRLAQWAAGGLRTGGTLVVELGVAQARRASSLRRLHPALEWVRGTRDYAGRLRVAVWRRNVQ